MDIRKQVGANLQRYRHLKGWSQEQLAFETGLHRTYISGIERGVRNPTIQIIKGIADSLGIPAAKMLESAVDDIRAHSTPLPN